MGRVVSDYQIRVPESAEPGACLEIVRCMKITAAPETPRGAKEQSWCYVNGQWVIYSEGEPPPPTQTITLQAAEDIALANGVIDELHEQGCPFVIQAVIICDESFDEVITFPGVSLNVRTPDNGYGFGVPGVDTAAPPPSTISVDGTWFGFSKKGRILRRGIAAETSAPEITDAVLSRVFFCDNPTCGVTTCGSANPSNGCRIAYAIYDDGTDGILVKYHISSTNVVTFVEQSNLPNGANGIVDGACLNGRLLISDGTCLYTTCGTTGLTKVVLPAGVPQGSLLAVAAAMGATDHYYALFGTSGVLHSRNGRFWEIAQEDLFFPAIAQQNGIVAVGDVVVTFGDDATLQYNNNGGGGSWFEKTVDSVGATDTIMDLALGLPNDFNTRYAFMYALTTNHVDPTFAPTDSMTVSFSNDSGDSWEARKTFDAFPDCVESATIKASVNGSRVYVSWDSMFWANFNYACETCEDWVDLSPDLPCCSTHMDVCPFEPNTVLMISDGVCDIFSRNDVAEVASGTPGVNVIVDVLANDRPAPGEALDPSTTAIVGPPLPANVQALTINPVTGEFDVQPDDGFVGVITFDYTVDDTAANTGQATVTIEVGDIDASLLVC